MQILLEEIQVRYKEEQLVQDKQPKLLANHLQPQKLIHSVVLK
jgi:hypothetical protein